jgi:hypothetical protein
VIVIALLVPEVVLLGLFALTALEDLLFPPPQLPVPEQAVQQQPVHPHRLPRPADGRMSLERQ